MQADLSVGAPASPEVEPDDELAEALAFDELGDELDLAEVPPVSELQVRDMLDGLGRAASVPFSFGVAGLWRFERDELDGLVPPLTRVINKRPTLARAVHNGDQIAVALQLSAYAGKRVDRVAEVRKRRRMEVAGERDRQAQDDVERADAASGGFAGLSGPRYANGDRGAASEP